MGETASNQVLACYIRGNAILIAFWRSHTPSEIGSFTDRFRKVL